MKELVNVNLRKYIEENIYPEYNLNDKGHNLEHIEFVLNRAYEISKNYNLNLDMLYVVVSFHDIACHINREEHEILSAKRMYEDEKLKEFFTEEQRLIMKEAIEDHRASLEYVPRNIYGKILSSADRKIDIDIYLTSSMGFSIKKNPDITDEDVIEESYEFAIKKFGKNGYATTKMYVEDKKYKEYLEEIQRLIDNKEEYILRAKKVLRNLR